ncbi:MAG TPA: hypothetical protein VN088_09410 [Nocardioides sp.]|nr:hypothetical protein [Nocardioides sp.]
MVHLLRRRMAAVAVSCVIAVLVGVAGSVVPATAAGWPAAPARVRITAVATTSLTVTAARAANATSYRLWTSPSRADLREPALSHPRAARHSASSRTPTVTVAGLTYRPGELYYRFGTVNGSHRRLSDIRTAYLRPAVPSAVTLEDPFGRPYLRWSDAAVTGYQVRQSSDPAGTTGVTTYVLQGRARAFTPTYAATAGQGYYLSVRAVNGTSRSEYSTAVQATPSVGRSSLSVLTSNDLNANVTRSTSGVTVPPWLSQRRDAALALYRRVDPDLLLIQEGGVLVANQTRQVDTIASGMGSDYTVAHTEGVPGSGTFVSHGVYIVYRNTRLSAVGQGSTLELATGKYAAFQVLRDRTTQRAFLVVTAHLVAGGTASADARRRQEMTDILAEAQRIATANGGVPIVLGGCLHEVRSPHHPSDSPYEVLGAAGFADALTSAQRRSGGDINTFNNYQRPIRTGVPTDRIFVGPGVAVSSWAQLLHRDGNRLAGVIPSDHNPVAATVLLPGS